MGFKFTSRLKCPEGVWQQTTYSVGIQSDFISATLRSNLSKLNVAAKQARYRPAELRLDVLEEGEQRKDTSVADHEYSTSYKYSLWKV